MVDDEGERQVTQVVEEPRGKEDDWTVEEYVRTVGRRLEKYEAGEVAGDSPGTIPVRLERMHEVMALRGDEHPRVAAVSAAWWRRVLADLLSELEDEGDEGGAG